MFFFCLSSWALESGWKSALIYPYKYWHNYPTGKTGLFYKTTGSFVLSNSRTLEFLCSEFTIERIRSDDDKICMCEIHGKQLVLIGFFGEGIMVGNGKRWACKGDRSGWCFRRKEMWFLTANVKKLGASVSKGPKDAWTLKFRRGPVDRFLTWERWGLPDGMC